VNPSRPRRRIRAVRLVSFVAAATLVAAACGSDSTSSSTAAPTTAGASTTVAATSAAAATTAGASTAPAGSAPAASTPAASAPAADLERGGTLTFGLSTDPISIQPRGGGAGNDQLNVARQLFDSLLEQDPSTGKLIPWLAESYDVSPDAKTFTFHLRDDVTFSDGTPLTAQVVKDNFDDIVASGAKATWVISYFAGYANSTVVDDHTVSVTFTTPSAAFPQAVATSGMGIVAESTLAVPFEDRATANLVGTGPFTLQSYTKDSEVVLLKRDGYKWAPGDRSNTGDAYLDKIVFKIIPEAGVRTGSLQSGQVAAIGGVPPQDIDTLRSGGFDIVARPNPGITFGITPVQNKAPLDDVRVRQAIAAAIDTTDVRDTVLSDDFAVGASVLSQTTPGFKGVDELIANDPDAAGKLLDEAGWTRSGNDVREKDGVKLHLVLGWLNNFGPNQAALELIQAQLAESGIDLELKSTTAPEFTQGLASGAYDLVWSNLSRADGDVLRTAFSTAGTNYYHVDDPELEALLQQQVATADPAARDQILAQIQSRIASQAEQIPVFELTTVLALTDEVHDVSLGADSRLHQLTDAWVAA
jgi:peptide/nickel transport system substrate-binding protein